MAHDCLVFLIMGEGGFMGLSFQFGSGFQGSAYIAGNYFRKVMLAVKLFFVAGDDPVHGIVCP